MRLTRLVVQNWRGIAGPETVDFHEHLTVVSGPNESGKSSLRDALRMVLLDKFNSSSRTVKGLRPWETQLYPTATLDFVMGADQYQVYKQFMRRKDAARLQRNGRLVAEDDQVQTALDELLGPYGQWLDTLWGLQGQTALAAVPDSLKGRLAAASQETVSPGVAWLEQRIGRDYDQYWTEKKGQPKASLSEVRARTIEAEAVLQEAARALEASNEREAALTGRTGDLERARLAHTLLEHRLRQAEADLQAWETWRQARAELGRRESQLESRRRWLDGWRRQVQALEVLAPQVAGYAARLAASPAGQPPSRQTVEDLRLVEAYLQQSIQLELWQQIEQLPLLEAQDLSRLQVVDRELKSIENALRVGLLSVSFEPERRLDVQVEVDGESHEATVEAGVAEEWQAASTVTLAVPGLGRLQVRSGNAQAHEQLERRSGLQKELAGLLKKAKARTSDEAVARAQQRSALEARVSGERPDAGHWESLRAQISNLADLDPIDKPARLAALRREVAEAEVRWQTEHAAYAAAQEAYQKLLRDNPQDRLEATWQSLRTLIETAPDGGDVLTPQWSSEAAAPLAAMTGRRAEALAALTQQCEELAALVVRPPGEEVSPDLLERLRTELDVSSRSLQTLDREVQQAIGGLQTQGEVFAQYARAEEAKARAQGEQSRMDLEADAVKLLWTALREAREKLQKEIVAPLEARVADRLQDLTAARYRGVKFDRELRLESVVPKQAALAAVQDLSFGTQEQLLLLTRLCLAELLSEQNAPQVLILDDNLVHTDDNRMTQACDMLLRAAERVQVVVFTCHPERYPFAPPVAARHVLR